MSVPIVFKHRKYIQSIKEFFKNAKQRRTERDIRKGEQLVLRQKEADRLAFLNTPIYKILYNVLVGDVEKKVNFSKFFTYENVHYELRATWRYEQYGSKWADWPRFILHKIHNINRRSIDEKYSANVVFVLEECYDRDITHDNVREWLTDLWNLENNTVLQEKIFNAIMMGEPYNK